MYYTVTVTKGDLKQEFVQWLTAKARAQLTRRLQAQVAREPGISWTMTLTRI